MLYVNLELDRASCLHRFRDVYGAMGVEPANLASIDVWNLRGKSKPMDQLAPSLIRRALKTRPIAVVIDPIYKVITGDENSADQMAAFCNQFDRAAMELGCAVVPPPPPEGQPGLQALHGPRERVRRVRPRPDALLDMIELEQTDALRQQQEDAAVCARRWSASWPTSGPDGWRDVIGDDDRLTAKRFLEGARALLDRQGEAAMLEAVHAAREAAKARNGVAHRGHAARVPALRSAEPVVRLTRCTAPDSTGALSDVEPEGEAPPEAQPGQEAHAGGAQK